MNYLGHKYIDVQYLLLATTLPLIEIIFYLFLSF